MNLLAPRLPLVLQVSFSRGNVLTLHNLELNLAPLLGGAASMAHVRRAFARRLSITIPWTALTTQPIQARVQPCSPLEHPLLCHACLPLT